MADTVEELERILNDKGVCTSINQQTIVKVINVLNCDTDVKPVFVQKLLEICLQTPTEDVVYAKKLLNLISLLLRKVAVDKFTTKPDLLPSMRNLLFMLNTSIYTSTSDDLKVVYFKMLLLYPEELYGKLNDDDKMLELCNLYIHQRFTIELRVQPILVLQKYVKASAPESRRDFVEKGIHIWFRKLIPSIMSFVNIPDFEIGTCLSALELIADEFQYIDYYEHISSYIILQSFFDEQNYPSIMKNLLMRGSNIWHRLWIIFIKILKTHLTKTGSTGSPINSMLPVVETAFKMEMTNRCRAFECWIALIDNFATETCEIYIKKRIKLLVIPLYANNAKHEEIVMAKINCWWHFICTYNSKSNNFAEDILIPFLQFCFGKPIGSSKSVQMQGMLTCKTKEYCVKALVNIFGHHNCDGCVDLPMSKDKILNDQYLLARYMQDLVYYMNVAIKIVAMNAGMLRNPYKCAWTTFIKLIDDTADDILRRNSLIQLLEMIENLLKDIQDEILADIVMHDLILTLLRGDGKVKVLLNLLQMQECPIHKILLMILNPSFESPCNRNNQAVVNFKQFTDLIVENYFNVDTIGAFLNKLVPNYKSIVIWSAMARSICENNIDSTPDILCMMLRWPLKQLHLFSYVEISMTMWFVMFDIMHKKGGLSNINDEIMEVLSDSKNDKETSSFLLNVAIILLRIKINADQETKYGKEVSLIYNICNKFKDFHHTLPVFSKLLDILLELFYKLLRDINMEIAEQVLKILKLVFTKLQSAFQKSTEVDAGLLMTVKLLLTNVQNLLKLEAYALLNKTVLSDFLDYAQCFGEQKSLKATVLATLQTFLRRLDNNDPFIDNINKIINSVNEDSNHTVQSAKPIFTTPANKKRKKKESSIVNTVVEDGEEFVVVKSNWKFNPKKLTENQKEKLKRKREDIPALYQDLSQSQDEFKLNTWKTDSQDTTATTTSSKSNDLTTSEKISSILKNMPNTDVVPKILQNILTEKCEKINSSLELTKEHINEVKIPCNKEVKPRLSLKDRVFRNVKLLTENSDGQKEEKHLKSVTNVTTLQLKTPTEMDIKNSDANANVNSAPSEINIDRPSRVKRKPKKFDQMELFALKKMRNSSGEFRNKDSSEDLHNSEVVKEISKVEEIKFNTSEAAVSKNQESDQNILGSEAPNLVQDIIKHNDTQNKNNLNVVHIQIAQDKNVDNQTQSSKSNDIPTTSQIDIANNVCTDNFVLAMADKNQTTNDQHNTKEDCSSQNLSNKKTGKKKSRIEKELAIDMVEGHPFLKAQPEKRLTRNKASESPVISRRKSLTQKLNKSKTDQKNTLKVDKQFKDIDKQLDKSTDYDELHTFPDSQESTLPDENGSQDIIESSQDSTVSIMSVKSSKTPKRVPIVTLENIEKKNLAHKTNLSSKIINADSTTVNDSVNSNNDDSEFPLNKTAAEHNIVQIDLTANFDTEPIEKISPDEFIEIEDEKRPIASILNSSYIDMETQDIADADTQPIDSDIITKELENITSCDETKTLDASKLQEHVIDSQINVATLSIRKQEETTKCLTEPLPCAAEINQEAEESLSKLPPQDEEQRKQDFLNNTLEISPIKTLSPVRGEKSPSPETSSDYDVIKLSSPVQSNGEPFEKCDSPEIFTEEKVSPDKRDQSPPRAETRVNTASPRSLSLKKNKPQVRSGGRAAQMLGLCIPGPDRLQTIINSEKAVEADEPKKSSPKNSSARRNLRMLYNSTNESSETSGETEESNKFLTMNRSLPAADSGPSVPILKRKLVDIVDDSTVSPASKRKRVSFHDPPVSTTVCVKKYIESGSVRSPQNSVIRRQERLSLRAKLEAGGNLKSQKRLDTEFKLNSALTNAVESFNEGDVTCSSTEDTEMSSLEPTPLVEVVKNSELNDVDPICLELIHCNDPVDNIAGELSSSAMRPLLVKEFAGKIETVGDLAKLSELEVNRLCIKAPKVQVAKKVLTEYAKKVNVIASEMTPMTEAAFSESTVLNTKSIDVEMQTDCLDVGNVEVQTDVLATSSANTQTTIVPTVDCDVQTDESGSTSTEDIVKSLLEKPDLSDQLIKLLDVPSKQSIATSLPISVLTDTLVQEMRNETYNINDIIDKLLKKHTSDSTGRDDNPRLSFMRNYLSERFNSKELILLCSDLLKEIHDSNV